MDYFVHAYYGNGVGKTTRTVGLAVRAAGAGKKVMFFQFLKDGSSSEVNVLRNLPNIDYECTGTFGFIFDRDPTEEEIDLASRGIERCLWATGEGYDLIIADEALNALTLGLLREEDIARLISKKERGVELVLTGRTCPDKILELCDYATEFKMVKHPHERGCEARKGIDC